MRSSPPRWRGSKRIPRSKSSRRLPQSSSNVCWAQCRSVASTRVCCPLFRADRSEAVLVGVQRNVLWAWPFLFSTSHAAFVVPCFMWISLEHVISLLQPNVL